MISGTYRAVLIIGAAGVIALAMATCQDAHAEVSSSDVSMFAFGPNALQLSHNQLMRLGTVASSCIDAANKVVEMDPHDTEYISLDHENVAPVNQATYLGQIIVTCVDTYGRQYPELRRYFAPHISLALPV